MPHQNSLFNFFKNRELNELYLSVAIRNFGAALVGVFVPIYLITIGYSIKSVMLMYLILSLTQIIFSIPAAKIASRFGFKHAILFSIPPLILSVYILNLLDGNTNLIYLLAVLSGFEASLYWTGYHVDFCKFSKKKLRGSQIGIMNIIASLVLVTGPVLGGLILANFGFKELFIVISVIFVSSGIPLLFSKDFNAKTPFTLKGLFAGRKTKDYLAFIGHGIESASAKIIWPIYLFGIVVGSYVLLGWLTTITFFFSMIFTIFISRYSDGKRKTLLKIAAGANMLVWFSRIFVRTPVTAFATESAYGLTSTAKDIPFQAISYDKAKHDGLVQYIVLRDIGIQLGRVIFFGVLYFYYDYLFVIFSGAGASLLYLLF